MKISIIILLFLYTLLCGIITADVAIGRLAGNEHNSLVEMIYNK